MVSEVGRVENMKRYGEMIDEHGIVREKFCCPTEFHDFNINYKFQESCIYNLPLQINDQCVWQWIYSHLLEHHRMLTGIGTLNNTSSICIISRGP